MNHLRAVLEAADAGTLRFIAGIDSTLASEATRLLRSVGEQAVCFDFGDGPDIVTAPVIAQLCRLPYQVCWFEGYFLDTKDRPTRVGFLVAETPSGDWQMLLFQRQSDTHEWAMVGEAEVPALLEEGGNFFSHSATYNPLGVKLMLRTVRTFLTALHCKNVSINEVKPDAALQRARSKRGKQPLFSSWVLNLTDGSSVRFGMDAMGSERNGPRVHLRRGHPREFKPGQFTWVQAHVVGNAKLGMVHKDYRRDPSRRKPGRPQPPQAGA